MKRVYPVVFAPSADGGYVSYVPDLNINSQGDDMAEAIANTRDAIGLIGIDREDDGLPIPTPSKDVQHAENEVVSYVDIDFTEYRRMNDTRTVRRNVSLPSWLNAAAEKAGLNVSAVLQNALKQELRAH